MSDELHDERIMGDLVFHDKLIVHNLVWVASNFPVLISLTGKLLTLANEKVEPSLHLLVAKEVYFAVALLR